MLKFLVTLDKERFLHKPSAKLQYKNQKDKFGNPKTEVQVLGARLGSEISEVTVNSLAQAISNGQTWSPNIFNVCPMWKRRRRLEGLFLSTQCFGLDFDNSESLETIQEMASKNNLNPNIIHTSFSSTRENPKHRMIFVCDEPITDFETCKKISIGLADLFKSDSACVDSARLYYGSHSDCFIATQDNEYTPVSYLMKICAHVPISKFKKGIHKEIEWGDSETQAKIFSRLKRNNLNITKRKIQSILHALKKFKKVEGESRYTFLWGSTSQMARMPEITGKACYEWVIQAVKENPYFDDWDYNVHDVVLSAIEWSYHHQDDPIDA